MKTMSQERIDALASEFAASDNKTGMIGGYCEPGFPLYCANDEFIRMLGYGSLEELVRITDGKAVNTVHPDDLENVKKDIGFPYREGCTFETTYRLRRKDGSWFWAVGKGKIIRTEDGRLAAIGMCTDMSRFVRQQKALEERNTAADYMFKNLPGGYHRCAMDEGYSFLYVSERFLDLLGWTKEELVTKFDNKFANLIHPEDRNIAPDYVQRIIDGTLEYPYQDAMYRLQCKDGYHWFSDTTMKVTVSGATFFQGFITDISKFISEKQQKYEIISSLGVAFGEICQVDLSKDKFQVISGKNEGETGTIEDLKRFICRKGISEESKAEIIELLNKDAVQKRLHDTNIISWDVRANSGNWFTVSVIAQNRDYRGDVMQALLVARNVTEQKRKELEYQASLEEGLFAIADGFCKINLTKDLVPGAMYQVVNGERYNLNEQLGISENSSLTDLVDAWVKTIPEEGQAQFLKDFDRESLLQKFEAGQSQISFSYWTRTATFEPMLAEDHMELFRDYVSGDVMAINYVLDRTEQYRLKEKKQLLEEKTRELEKLLHLEREYSAILPVLRSIYDQIFMIDLTADAYHMIQASDGRGSFKESRGNAKQIFYEMANASIMDSYKQTVYEFIDFDTIAQRLSENDNIFAEYMDRDGNWRSLSFLVKERDAEGKPTQLLFTIRNINQQKEAELEQQRITETRLQTMTEAIHGGFKLGRNDKQCSFVMVSEQLAKMLGYDTTAELMEASGGCMSGIADIETAQAQMAQARESVEAGEMYTMHYRVRCKDGSWRNIEDRGRLIVNEKGEEEYWSFIVDQDEIVKTSEALEAARKANRALNQAKNELKIARDRADAANEAKTQFLFNMSHDIRTPMNAILGYSALAARNPDVPETVREYLKKIQISGQGLLAILDNVLELSRIESGKTVLEESAQIAGSVLDTCTVMMNPEIEKRHHTFVVSRQIQCPYIFFDPTRLTEILLNILSNAIKYTADGGRIECTLIQLPNPKSGWVDQQFTVADNGIGMSETFLEHIYESFSRERTTTDSGVQGTGLGMGIVKKLVDLMGGTISIQSKLGKGTVVTVRIPCRIAAYEDTQPKIAAQCGSREYLFGKRVLLAEDNDLNAEIAATLLEEEGLLVERAHNGVECVEMLERKSINYYDLILMDIQMPVLNGYMATQKIRRLADPKKANIPIVAMTANAFSEDKQKAIEMGMNDHVAKPIDMNILTDTILKYLT